MPLLEKLRLFLDKNQAQYTHTVHSIAYTAREVAMAEHLRAREVAKVVVIHGDSGYHMLILPANKIVDFQEVRIALGLGSARMVPETELNRLFPDCELGAMPALGNLYGMAVYLDSAMAAEDVITFNAGTHRDVIHMRTAEFRRLACPTIVSLAREAAGWR
jgi:Ala-tRNA(Pro) deacylase